MSLVWRGAPELVLPPPHGVGLALAAARGGVVLLILACGVVAMALARLVERPFCGLRRPVTPAITLAVCRLCLAVLGLRVRREGARMTGPGVVVANHSSWLDVLVLNAGGRMVFVSKAEVASWPGIGLLARLTGTLFIRREARGEVAAQAAALGSRLRAGQRLAVFPEGTSTDGRRVLPFKPSLFAGLLAADLPSGISVQPVTLAYHAPAGEDPRFYGWWGGAGFGPSALAVLACRRPGEVRVTYHPPIPVVACPDRKALAQRAEAAVRGGLVAAGIRP